MNTSATTRLLVVLLAVSLAGNAALLWRAGRTAPVPASADGTSAPRPRSTAAAVSAAAPAAAVPPETAAALSRALSSTTSLAEFRTLLEAADVPLRLQRSLLQVALNHHYTQNFRHLTFPYGEKMRREWWRDPEMEDLHASGPSAKRREEETLELSKRYHADLAAILGEDPSRLDLDDPDNAWLARRFSGLPREKAEALHRIERDYQELEQEIQARTGSFQLPADEEKLRLLKREQERDIAALLTPEERAEWELRASPTADRARNYATRYRATEEEYRRIFALQKTFDEAFDFSPLDPAGADAPDEQDWDTRHEAAKALEAEIRAIFGEARIAEALRRQSTDFTLAQAATQRLGLPADTPDRIYALREPAATASRRIATDPKLTPEERKTSLARLAADTRAQLESTLGADAASAYLRRGGMGWLTSLENGTAIQLDPDTGDYTSYETPVEPIAPVAPAEPPKTIPARVPTIRID